MAREASMQLTLSASGEVSAAQAREALISLGRAGLAITAEFMPDLYAGADPADTALLATVEHGGQFVGHEHFQAFGRVTALFRDTQLANMAFYTLIDMSPAKRRNYSTFSHTDVRWHIDTSNIVHAPGFTVRPRAEVALPPYSGIVADQLEGGYRYIPETAVLSEYAVQAKGLADYAPIHPNPTSPKGLFLSQLSHYLSAGLMDREE